MTQQAVEYLDEKNWKIIGLPASKPFDGLEEKMNLFGQFVGDWDILEERYLNPDGTWVLGKGEIHWNWILEGRGVQDVWGMKDETGRFVPVGTTIRFFDPKIDAWRSTWISPVQGAVKEFIGRKIGEEIVLEAKNEKGHSMKWIFSEITKDSFRWRAEELENDGKAWTLKEEMRVRRR